MMTDFPAICIQPWPTLVGTPLYTFSMLFEASFNFCPGSSEVDLGGGRDEVEVFRNISEVITSKSEVNLGSNHKEENSVKLAM